MDTWYCLQNTCSSATVNLGQPEIVNIEVIPHLLFIQFMTFLLNILGDVSYTDMQGGVVDVAKAVAFRGVF